MTNREIFRKNFIRLLDESGKTQVDVAEAVNVNRSTVSAWVTGRGYPRADVVQKLSRFFGCQLSDLVIANEHEETEEDRLLSMFRSLNLTGKAKLLERAEELTVLYGGKSGNVSDRQVHNL